MINKEEFTLDWIVKVSKENENADKILVEKVIRAFLLLEGLAKHQLPFVFKGGTALMLHLNSSKRLSIDIDIILPLLPNNLDEILDKIATEQGFLRKTIQHRVKRTNIVKEHYQFFYVPIHKSHKTEEYILLDILFEKVNYSRLERIPIQSSFLPTHGEPVLVEIPSLEDILGDKLTAFAPNTTGIPYFKKEASMSMEIIKQLYDIGSLFDVVNNADIIKSVFLSFAKTELSYRELNITESDVLDDIFQTSLCIVTRGASGKGNFEQLQLGIKRLKGYIFSELYYIEKAIIHASKAAYLSQLIKSDAQKFEKFEKSIQMIDWVIEEPAFLKLNKLKKSNSEAFFYWYQALKLL